MTLHELHRDAAALLAQGVDPNTPVVSGLDRSGYGEDILELDLTEAFAFNGTNYKSGNAVPIIDIRLSDDSTHSTTPR